MPNLDNPRGFWPLSGCPKINSRAQKYTIASTYGTTIAPGDPVSLLNTGTVGKAGAGDVILGVCAGVNYIDSNGVAQWGYWPASTAVKSGTVAEILVYDDPSEVFVVQVDGSMAAADVGLLSDSVAGTASTIFNRSSDELNASGGTSTAGWRVVGKYEVPGNDWGTNVDVLVVPYEHQYGVDDTLGV